MSIVRTVRPALGLGAVAVVLSTTSASAHHEALFGPQSSLAVESEGFVSLQTHSRAYGINGTETQETTFILSGGLSPIADVPWSITLVQPFTYQTSRQPTPAGTSGPFTACDGCLARENNLVATSYRFDLTALQRATGKDGNFALLSAALELPTGNKDYPTLKGPFNFIGAGMLGFEWGSFSAVALGYYRRNTPDSTSSKKGDNFLLGAGFAYTPVETERTMLSLQLGVGDEYHLPDVDHGVSLGGGNEVLVSPTVVVAPRSTSASSRSSRSPSRSRTRRTIRSTAGARASARSIRSTALRLTPWEPSTFTEAAAGTARALAHRGGAHAQALHGDLPHRRDRRVCDHRGNPTGRRHRGGDRRERRARLHRPARRGPGREPLRPSRGHRRGRAARHARVVRQIPVVAHGGGGDHAPRRARNDEAMAPARDRTVTSRETPTSGRRRRSWPIARWQSRR